MAGRNQPKDVFRYIDMCHGDVEQCWHYVGTIKTDKNGKNPRPYFSYSGKKYLAYRVVFDLFHPDNVLTTGEVVRHTCDNSICCNPTHLERGTHIENMKDMRDRERHGIPHHAVKAIKRLLLQGKQTHAQIGKLYGVSRETISAIHQGRTYVDVHADKEGDV